MADTIEEASTGRASCRFCKEKIEKGALRFGERVPSAFGEGEQTLWYHLLCAAERQAEKLSPVLAEYAGELPDRAKVESIVENGLQNPKLASVQKIDHAPTARAKCQQCHEAIAKGALRIGVDRDTEGQMPAISYIHLACAPAYLGSAGLEAKLLRLSAELSEEDRAKVARLGAPA